ncbi:C40 family peptidase [Streptomyces sp. 7-21]|jgi:cell wall-associated NlpC family hydrolase|uniref:C40 family peptidase n=1 Tax=Streptomyces sp. 7-21 TaxID=2802283 RepID=UPI00191D1EC2|nr:C40 family peptidase [Streptomyces sp. 7-21]MBL1065488.1 C40 family peptidase [Streptomyces sp. 7-21]
MSRTTFPNRYRGRHRKPRQPRPSWLVRGGVLTGVAGTVAVTGAASSTASAEENPSETSAELPAVDPAIALDEVLADTATRASDATHSYVTETETRQAREQAQQRAVAEARREAAERREREERRERQERERREAAARAEAQARAQAQQDATAQAQTQSAPVTSSSGSAVVDYVRAQLGDGYVMGATGPDAWDCSSLVQAAYASVGVSLPRTAAEQSVMGTQVSLDALQPGDILYWGSAGSAYHVAIYVGGGTFIGAQNSSTGVVERSLDWDPPTGAVRVS